MARRVVYVVSGIHKSNQFEWTADRLRDKCDLAFVLLNPDSSPFESFLRSKGIPVERIRYRGKRDFPLAWLATLYFLAKWRPVVVHAHLFEAQLIALSCAWLLRIKRRIYTRHTSTLHHVYHRGGVKYDRISNFLSTHIVSLSQATDKVLVDFEKVDSRKLVRIPHGFDFNEFNQVGEERIQSVRHRWRIPEQAWVVGVIARHIEWKGVQYIVPAFREFCRTHSDGFLILANAGGPYHEQILETLKGIPADRYVLIPFEDDVAALYKLFNVYVHAPVDPFCEAFGQTYIEALSFAIPSIFTLSGIAADFVEHDIHARTVGFRSTTEISEELEVISSNRESAGRLAAAGREKVMSLFDISNMVNRLATLYEI